MGTGSNKSSRPIAVLKLPEYRVPLLLTCARAIVRSMTGNAAFAAPDPPLSVVEAAIDALSAAETATRSRTAGTVAVRDGRRLALVVLLQQLRSYVQTRADANPDRGASIIESAGMSVKRPRELPARIFNVRPGRVSGSVTLLAPKAADRAGYEWTYSLDGGQTWHDLPFTLQAGTSVSGLQPGATALFRYRPFTRGGAGDWSQVASIIVQ